MNALNARKRLQAAGYYIREGDVLNVDDPPCPLYVWFSQTGGEQQLYGTPAENMPMAWLRLERYLARRKS